MGDKAFRDGVISNLRACLLSAKGGVSFSKLNSEYKKIVGESIPFRKLGYPSLEEFSMSVDGLAITKKGSDWNVTAKPTQDSIHLSKLIAFQKCAPKKRSRGLPLERTRRFSNYSSVVSIGERRSRQPSSEPEALKVRLHDIPESMFNSEMVAELSMLAPSSDKFLLRLVTPGTRSTPPVIELFKRVEANEIRVNE